MEDKHFAFIQFCKELASLSHCSRGKVAAILIAEDFSQVFSIGVNGGASKQANCLCDTGKYGCVHAEQNCLAKNTDFVKPKIMICTKQCCQTCAALMVNSNCNIKEFWYIEDYSDNTGLEILRKANIIINKL